MNIVPANPSHAAAIREIYAPFITEGFVTFETQVPDLESFKQRIVHYGRKYPWLVLEEGGLVLGYAYASTYREREAYQWVVECSVYVQAGHRKKGVAAKLYAALFELLQSQGIYKVYAVITVPNPQSIGFHEKMGFKWFATYDKVGFKAGQWCDVGWWQLELAVSGSKTPSAPTPFSEMDEAIIEAVLRKHAI